MEEMATYQEIVRMIEAMGLKVTSLDPAANTMIVRIPPVENNRSVYEE